MLTRPSPVQVPSDEQHWIDRVEELVGAFAATVAADDLDARLPLDHLTALSEAGIDAAFLPVEHGGRSLSYATLGQVVRILASCHPALATVWLMHIGAAHALVSLSPPEAAEFFATELRDGKRFSNALSEPAGGKFFLDSQQDAEAVGDGWVLDGRKLFVSGSEAADHLFLSARVGGAPAFFGVTVDDTITFPPIDETIGMRATRSRTMTLTRTPLRAARLCAPPAPGHANLISIGFAFVSIGIAESAIDALTDYATARRTTGAPTRLADESWVKSETGMVWAEVRAARLLAEQVSWLADERSLEAMPAAAESKMLANEVAKRAAAVAVKIGGGGGFLLRSPIQRIFRDAQAGALMAYSVPFSQEMVGGWVLGRG